MVATYNTPFIDSNLTKKVGENIYFFTKDGLGSIRNIHDASEVLKNSYDYFAFGSIFGSPTENIANRYRYTSREWESIPSLHFYRARMMDQTLGRFLSKDPIFYPNLYVYVLNNPSFFTDPRGLECKVTKDEGWKFWVPSCIKWEGQDAVGAYIVYQTAWICFYAKYKEIECCSKNGDRYKNTYITWGKLPLGLDVYVYFDANWKLHFQSYSSTSISSWEALEAKCRSKLAWTEPIYIGTQIIFTDLEE